MTISTEKQNVIRRLVEMGFSGPDIAKIVDCRNETVYRYAELWGYEMTGNKRQSRAVKHFPTLAFRILYGLLQGESQSELARSYGVSRQRVHQILCAAKEAGFDVPHRT